MSDSIQIKASETGAVRLFIVDIAPAEIDAFRARNGRWPLREALGAEALDPDHIDIFDAADLTGVGLSGYLSEGHAIPDDQINEARAQLEALQGTLMVVTSSAFLGQAQTLTPRAPLRLIASFSRAQDPITFQPLPDASARTPVFEEKPPRKTPSDAAMSGRVASVVLLVLALLVLVMVWIAS